MIRKPVEIKPFEEISHRIRSDQARINDDPKITTIAEIESEVLDVLENGVPITVADKIASAIVYLFFDGGLFLHGEQLDRAKRHTLNHGLNSKTVAAVCAFDPEFETDIAERTQYSVTEMLPFYFLEVEKGDIAARYVQQAYQWIQENDHTRSLSCRTSFGKQSGYIVTWIEGRDKDPEDSPEFQARLDQLREADRSHSAAEQIREYKERHEWLLEDRDEDRSFQNLQFSLLCLLDPDVRDDSRYQRRALEVGQECVSKIPQAWPEVRKFIAQCRREGYLDFEDSDHVKKNKSLPRYINLLSQLGRFEEAIAVCEQCIAHNIHDGTKKGFEGRKALLQKKMMPKGNAERKKRFTDDEIRDIVTRYRTYNAAERKQLAAEYDLKMSYLTYIVSKNKSVLESEDTSA